MPPIIFFAAGIPKGQPRVRAFVRGRHAGVYDPGTADDFKASIHLAARSAMRPFADRPIFPSGPVRVTCEFVFPRPKSHFTSKGQIKADAPVFHTQKPDRDNLDKAVLDTLTKIEMWRDDSQVCFGQLIKRWAALGEPSGVQITITAIAA